MPRQGDITPAHRPCGSALPGSRDWFPGFRSQDRALRASGRAQSAEEEAETQGPGTGRERKGTALLVRGCSATKSKKVLTHTETRCDPTLGVMARVGSRGRTGNLTLVPFRGHGTFTPSESPGVGVSPPGHPRRPRGLWAQGFPESRREEEEEVAIAGEGRQREVRRWAST